MMAASLWLAGFVVFAFIATSHSAYTPLVLMHGIADTSAKMQHITELVQQHLPGIYVVALEVTGSKIGSIFTGSNKQVEMICAALSADSKLAGGINVMGVSQGGILLRGYLERCNNPPVKNFISWVAPMMGVYGVPEVGHLEYLNVTLDEIADCCVYQDWAQNLLSFAGYWRDPFALDAYLDRNIFLADINNEGHNKNPTYKKNVLTLDNFVMSYSTADTVLIPLETGWFGAYANGTDSQVVPLEKQPFYEFDYIGLRTLDQAGKLHRFTTDCIHEDYTSPCFDKYFLANVLPFLAA